MKILHINSGDQGGAANACIRLHKGLLDSNVNSKLLVFNKSNNDTLEVHPLYTKKRNFYLKKMQDVLFRYRKRKVLSLAKDYEGFSFPYSIHNIEKHKLIEWADIINLHSVGRVLNYPSFFKKVKKPIIWTMHDMNPFSGGYYYNKKFPLEAYQKHIKANERLKLKSIEAAQLNIVSPSNWLGRESKSSNVFGGLPHSIIPYGIDHSVFKPVDRTFAREVFNVPKNNKVLLFIANSITNKRKGAKYLLEALSKLNDSDVTLVMIGNNIETVYNHPNLIKFNKIKDERLMAIVFSMADIFVIPSIEDNLPNTVVESISCGTPVIGFNIGGIPDMIVEGKNGLICDKIDVQELTNTLKLGLKTNFDRDWIRQDALNRFNQSIQANNYINLYKKLLNINTKNTPTRLSQEGIVA